MPTNTGVSYWANEQFQARYDYYSLKVHYRLWTGAYQQPVSGPTQPISKTSVGTGSGITPCELVQLESPHMKVTVAWTAKRIGAKPTIPNPWPPANSPFTLLYCDFGGENPQLMEDSQTYIFELSGFYEYALALPILPGDSFQIGAVPVQTLPTNVMVIGAQQFSDAIFNLASIAG